MRDSGLRCDGKWHQDSPERGGGTLDLAGFRTRLGELDKYLVAGLCCKSLVFIVKSSRGQLPQDLGDDIRKCLKALGDLLGFSGP